MLKEYTSLTKPGIVRGNAMTAIAGFLLAAQGNVYWKSLVAVIIGLGCIIASACVCNNYIDKDIDQKMSRTSKRALATGGVPVVNALIFAFFLLIIGTVVLGYFTTTLATIFALFGFFMYVIVYGYFKRVTVFSTEIGSISGAVPPVVGYCAFTGRFDIASLCLFLLLVFWQMPHFYAVGIFRLKDYKKARIPILPVSRGLEVTKKRILIYIIVFTLIVPLLTIFGYTGITYLIVMLSLSVVWFYRSAKGYNVVDTRIWAGKMFGFSLIVLTCLCVILSINSWIP